VSPWGGSVNGEELSDAKFHPFWAKAEELGVLVFLHPPGVPDLDHRLQGNGLLTNVIGNPPLSDAKRAAMLGDTACALLRVAS
jgi:predicted TIM-barrel fold metal-dependent hydrolase